MNLLNERETAARLGLSVKTLQLWRSQRKGPTYVKVGKAVRYRPEDVERFVMESRVVAL